MFKRSFLIVLIGVLAISMTVIWVNDAGARSFSRSRQSPYFTLYLEDILTKIKVNKIFSAAYLTELYVVNLSLGCWYQPNGVLHCPSEGDAHQFLAPFDITAINLIDAETLKRAKEINITEYWPECELQTLFECCVPMFNEAGEEVDCEPVGELDEKCYKRDAAGVCENWVTVCQKTYPDGIVEGYFDYCGRLPAEAYWDTGHICKWWPAQTPCDDNIFNLGEPNSPGVFIVEKLWSVAYKEVCKDEVCTQEPLGGFCFQLEPTPANGTSADRLEYTILEGVDACECGYQPACE